MNSLPRPSEIGLNDAAQGLRLIAMYLPQFHPIPENDLWWGTNFTEWTNVVRATPRFSGHHQPHIPADLGFYDLRLPEVRELQAALAREHGIHGFCYYHYWFNGKRLLERPLSEVLKSGKPDLPFCICWANENWTRRWDGLDRELLIGQSYSPQDDLDHIRHLLPILADPRYIRVGGKPVLSVYRTGHLPDPLRTAEIWREEALKQGIGELYLCRFEAWDDRQSPDPRSIGFDAAVEFAPDWRRAGGQEFAGWKARTLSSLRVLPKALRENRLFDYRLMAQEMLARPAPGYPLFRGVTPGFDNSARRKSGAMILRHSSPEAYQNWLEGAIAWTRANQPSNRQLIFVNAWNEWAEGNHLEPDLRFGHAYLRATAMALESVTDGG